MDLIRPQGHIVSIVENSEPLEQKEMKMKAASFSWECIFARSMYQTPDIIKQHHLLNRIVNWIDEGKVQGTAGDVMSLINAENLRTAHATLEAGRVI
ncbi:Zinc-type alcohol dehydrogenase-like protein [Polystyrenella longa]|uniref:Zinc-type alcohol dehydrogenase-like protein n=1 Tax=Polystyrenella longa TaxID=2528007 RepID=A0A518CLZ9_9PLAN|nr:Zinc-type alcohol dehydrogenase-like protein [Polystyrenella longa]